MDRIVQLTQLLADLVHPDHAIDKLAFRKSLERRAANSVKALANDLGCYAAFASNRLGHALPARAHDLVAYLEDCEARGLSPATASRRLASLAAIHALLGASPSTGETMVRDAMIGYRKRIGSAQRQAGPLRYGPGIEAVSELDARRSDEEREAHARRGFTLTTLLAACDGDPPGLRDAALLSLAYDTGLRVSELLRVAVAHTGPNEAGDGSGTLFIPISKTDRTGKGAYAWISPESMRRISDWLEIGGIRGGPMFRRIAVRRAKARPAQRPMPIHAIPYGALVTRERVRGRKAELAKVAYAIGGSALTPAAVRLIIKRTALRAADLGLVELYGAALEEAIAKLSTHSLRVGLTQDLFASGADAGPIAQALRWSSTATALRYGRELAPASNATAQMLRNVRR
ncbi:site-specific integrase [Qipengyuania citrea]|uniref:site-specific integrase n=1 Tax=Qipengyuania citrea TaxID=225971 RepID=UPI003297B7AB